MSATKPRHSKEEFARRGDAIYKNDILPNLASSDVGKFLAIDIETGDYEIATDEMKAGDKLLARRPEAQIWMVRIGYAATHSFGGRQARQVAEADADPLVGMRLLKGYELKMQVRARGKVTIRRLPPR